MKRILFPCAVAFGLIAAGCASGGGDTDGGNAGDLNFDDTQFVPGDGKTGSIDLVPNVERLQVGTVEGFRVFVKDKDGQPVENVSISCDSEQGLAIIEPTTGSEGTDSAGQISGKFGCAVPGSLRLACRLPIGANKRDIETIVCTGDIPTGFDGFPGAAGGGLGGGVQNPDDAGPGGEDINGVSITAIGLLDIDGESITVDTRQQNCADAGQDPDPEDFSNDLITISVVNNTNRSVDFVSMQYRVGGITSRPLSFVGQAKVDANGGTGDFQVLAFRASGGSKFFNDAASTQIPAELGFRNVSVSVTARTDLGETFTLTAAQSFAFQQIDRCG